VFSALAKAQIKINLIQSSWIGEGQLKSTISDLFPPTNYAYDPYTDLVYIEGEVKPITARDFKDKYPIFKGGKEIRKQT
jgi:hypothetical protein